MRLLIVEDHPELGPDIKAGLQECSYAVDLVTNGEDAIALASLVPYDLLILDILLPDLDGWGGLSAVAYTAQADADFLSHGLG